jgi:hypothetical protein
MTTSSASVNAFYVAINIENILYGESSDAYYEVVQTHWSTRAGIELLLYFKTIRILLSNNETHKKSNLFYALFSSIMVFLITVWIVTEAIFGQHMWLLDSDFPGGPAAYMQANIGVWYMDWAATGVIVLQLMTDALMVRQARGCQNVYSLGWFQIYRCRIIWNSYHVIVVPIILWLTTLSEHHPHTTSSWSFHSMST